MGLKNLQQVQKCKCEFTAVCGNQIQTNLEFNKRIENLQQMTRNFKKRRRQVSYSSYLTFENLKMIFSILETLNQQIKENYDIPEHIE